MGARAQFWFGLAVLSFLTATQPLGAAGDPAVFNVRDYGATGRKEDDARPAIQKAIDECHAAGGGVVRIPPGLYTSGMLHLRSHVRVRLDAGATLFASADANAYPTRSIPPKAALFYGEDLEDIGFEGEGIVDGQARYEWRLDDFEEHYDHKTWMQNLGKSLMRSFPAGFPQRQVYPHLVRLHRCKGIRVTGLHFLHSPAWTFALYACEKAVFDGLYIYTSLKEAVWADGIDLDGCRDVAITNCAIETGDDCVALVSESTWGPPLPCENVTITRCRLSSASAGIKFSEGNRAGIRNIRVSDTLFNHVNRGFAFITARGGTISNVTLANLTINCSRFDWFWAGDGQLARFRVTSDSEMEERLSRPGEPPLATIRDITFRDIVARVKGSTMVYGHTNCWLDTIRFENVHLFVSTDPTAPYDKAEHALDFRRVKNLELNKVEIRWEEPSLKGWKSALNFEAIDGLEIQGFTGRGAWPRRDAPAVRLRDVANARIRNCRALPGTEVFLNISGPGTRSIRLETNDLHEAKVRCETDPTVPAGAVTSLGDPAATN